MKTSCSVIRLYNSNRLYVALFLLFLNGLIGFVNAQNAEKFHPAKKTKQYIRSEWFASARVDSSGSMGNYFNALKNFRSENAFRQTNVNYETSSWYPLGPFKATQPTLAQLGLINSLWVDTTDYMTIYAGSNTGGIFKTTDGGENWFSLADTIITTGVLSIKADPRDKNTIYIGTGFYGYGRAYGPGVLKSSDGGLSWQQTGLSSDIMPNNFLIRDIELLRNKPGSILALLNTEYKLKGCIYRSTDDAAHWQEVYSGSRDELMSIIPDPVNPDVIYVTGTRLLKSIDAGLTWENHSATIPLDTNFVISRVEIAKTSADPDLMLAMVESYDTVNTYPSYRLNLFKSTNNGVSFSKLNMKYNPFAGYWKMEFEISPVNTDEFYLGGIWLYKYRIEDDSAKYIYCSDHRYHHDIRDLHVFPGKDKDILIMGNDGGVTKSETGAESWYDITRNGMNITQFYKISIGENSNMMFAGPQDANLSFYNFTTGEWTKNAKVGDAYDGAIDHQNNANVYLITFPPKSSRPHIFIMKSTDGGNFFNFYGIPDSTEVGRNDKPLAMDPLDANTLYVGVRNVWKSTDGALTWEKITNFPPEGSPKLKVIKISPSNNKVIAASFEGPNWNVSPASKLWISPDGGLHWFNITPTGSLSVEYAGIADITFHPEHPQKFWLSLDNEWVNHRVYLTTDGGITWQNFSEGLPSLPVNTITFVKGYGYDVLLAGTDVGIYYRDENMDHWVKFGSGLPLTIVSDIKISYARKKIVVGTFGRGLWETDLCMPVADGEMSINDTTEWSSKRKILQDVVINSGGKLIISSTIEMGLDRKIKVMPGGELIIDRGVLTNDCSGMWDGVRLYGTGNYNEPSQLQGKLTMLHGGIIQFADTAVKTIGIDEQGQIMAGTGGGIINANSAKFLNNKTGIEINPSRGINPSTFTLCQFASNKILPDKSVSGDLVLLKGCRGISFLSCQFENTLPVSSVSYHDRGIGINSFNSSFNISKLQSLDSVPFGINTDAVFKQLNYGVKASASSPGYTADISKAKFERNFTGVYLSGLNLSDIKNCSFNLNSPNVNDSLRPALTAIYIDRCSYINVSENTLSGPLGLFVPKSKSAGIIINNCGELNQIVYGNSISNINYAVLAQNSNRSYNGSTGLRFVYNWFDGNEYDLCITSDSTVTNNGIALHQGATGSYPALPAGNRFSHSKWHRDSDIHNAGELIYYHFSADSDSSNLYPLAGYRSYFVPSEQSYQSDSAYRPEYFLSDEAELINDLNLISNLYQQLGEELKNKTDGGNTGKLINEINSCTIDQSRNLASKLIALSPYLTPETLIELIRRQSEIPNTLIFDIINHNPHFIRNSDVLDAISEMHPQLPAYMQNTLAQASSEYSLFETEKSKLDAMRSIRDILFNRIAFTLRDSTQSGYNRLIGLLLSDDRAESYYLAAFIETFSGQNVDALNILSDIPILFNNSDPDKHNKLSDLQSFNAENFSEGNLPDSLNELQINFLNSQADASETGIYAENILRNYNLSDYNEPYIFPGLPEIVQPPVIPPVIFNGSGMGVYPVPAKNYVILDYFTESGLINGKLKILTISGQLIREIKIDKPYGQQIIDVSTLYAGVYLFVLSHEGGKIGEQKVIIIR